MIEIGDFIAICAGKGGGMEFIMKKQCKPWLFIAINIFAILNLLCYFAIRAMWSGIIRYTFDAMPYILLFTMAGACITGTLMALNGKYYRIPAIIFLILGLLFFGLDAYIISLTTEASHYFVREFLYGLFFMVIIAGAFVILFVFARKEWFHKRLARSLALVILFVGGLILYFDVPLQPNHIDCTPAVFAVEDTYQIVFTTSAKGTAWVEIDGVEYNDTYAGYRTTENRIHKITVPMEALDEAGAYTIYAKAMLLRGPYSSFQGRTISKEYHWRGVDPSDGLQYYAISDVHNIVDTPTRAGSYYGENLDFLINCGDQVSWIDRTSDLEETFRMCGEITGGQVPVVYARGNHETKGVKADELYYYVGAKGTDYYYTFRLGNVWGVVLDIGEDHADDFVEYYGAAKFDAYRDAQTAFLDEIIANADSEYNAPGVDYRIAVSHIPLTVKYQNDYAGAWRDAWVERLNQMNLTIAFSGHVHELWFVDPAFEEGAVLEECEAYSGKDSGNSKRIMTAAEFPAILVSRKSQGQQETFKEYVFDKHFIGVAAFSDGESTTLRYTNEAGEVIENVISPWFADITYGDSIIVENK